MLLKSTGAWIGLFNALIPLLLDNQKHFKKIEIFGTWGSSSICCRHNPNNPPQVFIHVCKGLHKPLLIYIQSQKWSSKTSATIHSNLLQPYNKFLIQDPQVIQTALGLEIKAKKNLLRPTLYQSVVAETHKIPNPFQNIRLLYKTEKNQFGFIRNDYFRIW